MSYSPRCSCTIRTARSRTSGENLLDLFMAPSSQGLEPPRNPGRFTPASAGAFIWRREGECLRTLREGFEGIGDAPKEPPIRGRQNVGESLSLPIEHPRTRGRVPTSITAGRSTAKLSRKL
ncbi:MAG: hypothetical protein EXR29_14220 [Betaproteobacteria bacterium]|nr:hypothetical protein [Betaproteobacteria bacterium]